ncbi:MAG: hypothetical protein CME06_11805 [Gemmatimonadetes bacterium]|nr:hypothetical protein [Gemmatimonadota bacterium]
MKLKRGDRVIHAVWGRGVVKQRLAYQAARVAFDSSPSLPKTLKLREIEFDFSAESARKRAEDDGVVLSRPPSGANGVNGALPAPAPPPSPSGPETGHAWQTLEALRLGVVPARGIREYTVAREPELASLSAMLNEERGCRVLWGDYGSGKTHLLEAAEQLALERGFATARITLDPRENALHYPLRLYRRIAASVRVPDQVGSGLDWLFEKLIDSPMHHDWEGRRASRFFSPYLKVLRRESRLAHLVRDYVAGEPVNVEEVNHVAARAGWRGKRMLTMSDFRTFGRMYVHLVGTLATWYSDAGLRGLVLLFDEVERVDALGLVARRYALEVLKHYAAVTIPPGDLAFEPDLLYRGGHKVHRELPLKFRGNQPLCTVFALTPLDEIRGYFSTVTHAKAYSIDLAPLRSELLPDLVRRIAAIYQRAYPEHKITRDLSMAARQRIAKANDRGEDSFRDAVRATVLLFDADRFRACRVGRA